MEHRELKKLVQLMNENELVELELEREGLRVCLRKAGAGAVVTQPMPVVPPVAPAPAAPVEAEAEPDRLAPGIKEITSPMVGTFYRRPSPESEPYVSVGDKVDDESVVCIVEAMKVNNELKAELRGEIVEIIVEDGFPVEYGQPLFRVKVA